MRKLVIMLAAVGLVSCMEDKKLVDSIPNSSADTIVTVAGDTLIVAKSLAGLKTNTLGSPSYFPKLGGTCPDGTEHVFQISQLGFEEEPLVFPNVNKALASPLTETFIAVSMSQNATARDIIGTFKSRISPEYCKDGAPTLQSVKQLHYLDNGRVLSVVQEVTNTGKKPQVQIKTVNYDLEADASISLADLVKDTAAVGAKLGNSIDLQAIEYAIIRDNTMNISLRVYNASGGDAIVIDLEQGSNKALFHDWALRLLGAE